MLSTDGNNVYFDARGGARRNTNQPQQKPAEPSSSHVRQRRQRRSPSLEACTELEGGKFASFADPAQRRACSKKTANERLLDSDLYLMPKRQAAKKVERLFPSHLTKRTPPWSQTAFCPTERFDEPRQERR